MHTWLFYEFQNDKSDVFRVNINAPTAHPSGTQETTCTPDGFVLEYDGRSQEIFQPIVGSKVTMPLLIGTTDNNTGGGDELTVVDDLIDGLLGGGGFKDGDFTVEIRRDPDGVNSLFWCGVLLSEQIEEENAPFPRVMKLTASDDLANLKYIDYEDFPGAEEFLNAIIKIIRQTRMADLYWGADVAFIRTIRFVQSNIMGSGDRLVMHKFISSDMRIAGPNGVKQPRTAWDVLEAIADTFMLSIYQAGGLWWCVPRARVAEQPLLLSPAWEYTRNAVFLTSPVILPRFPISSSSEAQILTGGRTTYLHPARAVTRTYKFAGTLPVVNTGLSQPYLDVIAASPYENDFGAFLETTRFTVTFGYQLIQASDASLSNQGQDRAGRYLFRFRVKCGDLYGNNNNVPGPPVAKPICTNQTPYPVLQVFNPQGQGAWSTANLAWETSDTIWEFWSDPVDFRCGDNQTVTHVYEMPLLPSDELGFEFELIEVIAYNADGNTSSGYSDARLANATLNVRFETIITQLGGNIDTIGFSATNDNNARDVIDLGEALFGDQISNYNSRGAIRRDDGSTYTNDEWVTASSPPPPPGGYFINQLIVMMHAMFRNRSRMMQQFRLYDVQRFFYNTFLFEGKTYVITNMRFVAGQAEYDIEAVEMGLSGITVLGSFEPPTPPVLPETPAEIASKQQGIMGSVQGIEQTSNATSGKILELQPPSVGGIVLKNAPGDADAVTYIAPANKSATVILPDTFNWFIYVAARVISTAEQFFTLNTIQAVSVREFREEWLAAFDGTVSGIYVRSSEATDVEVIIYRNGTALVSADDTYTAGQTMYHDLLPDGGTFDGGDAIAISVQTDVQPNDINVTLVLLGY